MKLILTMPWYAYDGRKPDDGQNTIIRPGTHTVIRMQNPFGYDNMWLVITGTQIGLAEESWRKLALRNPEIKILSEDE